MDFRKFLAVCAVGFALVFVFGCENIEEVPTANVAAVNDGAGNSGGSNNGNLPDNAKPTILRLRYGATLDAVKNSDASQWNKALPLGSAPIFAFEAHSPSPIFSARVKVGFLGAQNQTVRAIRNLPLGSSTKIFEVLYSGLSNVQEIYGMAPSGNSGNLYWLEPELYLRNEGTWCVTISVINALNKESDPISIYVKVGDTTDDGSGTGNGSGSGNGNGSGSGTGTGGGNGSGNGSGTGSGSGNGGNNGNGQTTPTIDLDETVNPLNDENYSFVREVKDYMADLQAKIYFANTTQDVLLRLTGDIPITMPLEIKSKVTIDLNGCTIHSTESLQSHQLDRWSLFRVRAGGYLIIVDTKGGGGIKATPVPHHFYPTYGIMLSDPTAKCLVRGGTICGEEIAVFVQTGQLKITGGKFTISRAASSDFKPLVGYENAFVIHPDTDAYNQKTAAITIKGGTFQKYNPAKGSGTYNRNYCEAGFISFASNENGAPNSSGEWYTVRKQ